jgi:hypothetical protein
MRRLTLALTVFSILVMSLHDFYSQSIKLPVVPITGAGLFLLVVVVAYPARQGPARLTTLVVAVVLAAAVLLNTLLISINFDQIAVKAPLGYLFGIGLLWATTSRDPKLLGPALSQAVTVALVIHVSAWCLQVAIYYATGVFVDATGWLSDNPSRHESAFYSWSYHGELQRFTGLYAEPAIYSTGAFFLVTWRIVANHWRPRLLDAIAVGTMVGSWSATGLLLSMGIGAAVLTSSRVRTAYKISAGIVFGLLAYMTVWLGKSAYFIERSARASTDSSINGRFVAGWEFLSRQADIPLLVGRGLGTYAADIGRGSGITDALVYTGALGTALLLVAFAFLFRIHHLPVQAYVLWLGSLLSSPQQTNLMWWAWAAGMMSVSMAVDQRVAPSPSREHLRPLRGRVRVARG